MVQEIGSQCRGIKVVTSCSQEGTSYSLVQTLLLQDISFCHNAQTDGHYNDSSQSYGAQYDQLKTECNGNWQLNFRLFMPFAQ